MIEQTGQNGPAELSVRVFSNRQLSFDILLDEICERLQDTRQQGSIKRIRKLETILDMLDQELEMLAGIPCQTKPEEGLSAPPKEYNGIPAPQTGSQDE
ncbi:MAG: hypothetical protein FWG27_07770 [Treponema sp.]|jgi:hypothetical protein|nr:hypothetical protein [Treponema sp.]